MCPAYTQGLRLTSAVFEHHASGFIYQSTDDTPDAEVLADWAAEIFQPSATRSPNNVEHRPVNTSSAR
jgi:hypothetical protein